MVKKMGATIMGYMGFRVKDLGFRVQGLGFGVSGLGLGRLSGSKLRVHRV